MMTTFTNDARMQVKVNRRNEGRLGAPPERILREIAFVLKMTQKVRNEIEVEQEQDQLVEA